MCWTIEASTTLAAVGLGSTAYVAYKGESKELWLPLLYFSLMETLQAFTYRYIGDCRAPANHVLTVLSYMHIAFQPFFINALSMHFIKDTLKKKIAPWVYTICFIGAIFFLLKLYPFQAVAAAAWPEACDPETQALCGTQLCAVRGDWHVAWNLPLNSLNGLTYGLGYFLPAFIIPLFYGAWRITLFLFLFGPFLATFLTTQNNEWPAVWCLFSIALLLIVIKTPLRKYFYAYERQPDTS